MIESVNFRYPLAQAADRMAAKGKDSPEKTKKAAEQFEALLIGQMLKSAREAGSNGGLGTGEDNAGHTGMEMAEQQFASLLASKGGLGLSRFITLNLDRKLG